MSDSVKKDNDDSVTENANDQNNAIIDEDDVINSEAETFSANSTYATSATNQNVSVNSTLVDEDRFIYQNYTNNRSNTIDRITLHIMDDYGGATPSGIQGTFNNNAASANYGVFSDGKIAQFVDERNTPWSDSDSNSNSRTISIEISNLPPNNINGVNYQYPVNDIALNKTIELCADIAIRNNLGPLEKGKNLFWHCDFTMDKACPGDYIKAMTPYIIEEANKIIDFHTLTNINLLTTNGSLSSCGDINIDPTTFSASRKDLTNANVLLENGVGITDEIDDNCLKLLSTIYSDQFTNATLIKKTTEDCLNVEDKVIKTIELLSEFDTDMSDKFTENGELEYANHHEYLKNNSLINPSIVEKGDSVSDDSSGETQNDTSDIPYIPSFIPSNNNNTTTLTSPEIVPSNSSEDKNEDVEQDKSEDVEQDKSEDVEQDKNEDVEQNEDEDVEQNEDEDVEQNEDEDVEHNMYTETIIEGNLEESDNNIDKTHDLNNHNDNVNNNESNNESNDIPNNESNDVHSNVHETILRNEPEKSDSPVIPLVLGTGAVAAVIGGKKYIDNKKKEKKEEEYNNDDENNY